MSTPIVIRLWPTTKQGELTGYEVWRDNQPINSFSFADGRTKAMAEDYAKGERDAQRRKGRTVRLVEVPVRERGAR